MIIIIIYNIAIRARCCSRDQQASKHASEAKCPTNAIIIIYCRQFKAQPFFVKKKYPSCVLVNGFKVSPCNYNRRVF